GRIKSRNNFLDGLCHGLNRTTRHATTGRVRLLIFVLPSILRLRSQCSREEQRMVLVLMGVVGSGKTTVGKLLAMELGWRFADADDFHPRANVDKIRRGIPLDDCDRVPWLSALHDAIEQWNESLQNVVLACSALKQSYRNKLRAGSVHFVYLKGSQQLIASRLRSRQGHFASESILASQFADL